MPIKHLNYKQSIRLSPWRKVSLGSWKPTGDSSIHAFEDIVTDDALKWCADQNVSFGAFVIKALSKTIEQHPEVNRIVRFNKIYQRSDNRIFYFVLPSKTKDDLSGALIDNAFEKEVPLVETELKQQVQQIRKGTDDYQKSKKTFKWIPPSLSRITLNTLSFITYSLNILPFFIPSQRDPFGSLMVTNIGSLDLSKACTPIAPYTRIPMVIAIGKHQQKAIVINGEVEVKTVATFGFTFDHRIMDGIHFSRFFHHLNRYFKHPEKIEE